MRQPPVQQGSLRIPCTAVHNLISSPAPLLIKYAALFILLTQVTWAQVSLGLSSSGVQSGVLALNIVLSSPTGSEPAALQWTLAYPTASVTQAVVRAGPQATAAAKSLTCTAGSGSQTCVLYGLNLSKILNGTVATATLQLSATTTGTPSGIQFTNVLGASAAATAVTISTSSVIQVVPVIRSLLCSPTSITAPASASCTLTLSAAAPASGVVVSLGAAATGITFSTPASVTVASGQTTAVFAVSVSAASASGTVTTTASLNGSSVSSSFSVQPAPIVQSVPPIRVNCGGPQYTDVSGHLWSADYGFSTGSIAASTAVSVSGTTDPVLFKTYRYQQPTLQYQFSMPNGTHTVNLGFAETAFSSVGTRVFNIVLNGQTVRSNLDIYSVVGANKALVLTFPVTVTNGQVLIQLVAVAQYAKMNTIEIIP
jgi:hypothetical protein